jgi:hypothetical protein
MLRTSIVVAICITGSDAFITGQVGGLPKSVQRAKADSISMKIGYGNSHLSTERRWRPAFPMMLSPRLGPESCSCRSVCTRRNPDERVLKKWLCTPGRSLRLLPRLLQLLARASPHATRARVPSATGSTRLVSRTLKRIGGCTGKCELPSVESYMIFARAHLRCLR